VLLYVLGGFFLIGGAIGFFAELTAPSGSMGLAVALLALGALFCYLGYLLRRKRKNRVNKTSNLTARINEVGMATELPIVSAPIGVVLRPGERCCYQADASVLVVKNQVVGRAGGGGGVSVRVAKGVSVRSSSGSSRTVREDVAYTYPGIFSMTDQRFVMTGEKAFEYPLDKLTSLTPYNGYDGINLQFGQKSYTILMPEPFWIPKIIDLLAAEEAQI